jgi:hypothetical protein
MTEAWKTIKASEVKPGDTIRVRGTEVLVVARIEPGFMGREGMLAFIEDSSDRWFKAPSPSDVDVELLVTGA